MSVIHPYSLTRPDLYAFVLPETVAAMHLSPGSSRGLARIRLPVLADSRIRQVPTRVAGPIPPIKGVTVLH